MRKTERMMDHLSQVEKTFKVEKLRIARDLLLHQSLTAVQKYRDDPQVLETYTTEATKLVQGHVAHLPYNMCLGLLAARLIFW